MTAFLPMDIMGTATRLAAVIESGEPCYCAYCGAVLVWERELSTVEQVLRLLAAGVRPMGKGGVYVSRVLAMIKHIQQPLGSNMCGHAVAAMLARTTTAHVAAMLGHRGPTTWQEVYSVLHVLGVVCDVRQVPVFGPVDVPRVAVVRCPTITPVIKHFVVVHDGLVYDPALEGVYPIECLRFSLAPPESVLYCAEVRHVI